MASLRTSHPTAEQLVAFGQGRLSTDDAAHVEMHLEHCSTCCKAISNVTCDDELARLAREVHAQREISTSSGLSEAVTQIEPYSSSRMIESDRNQHNPGHQTAAENFDKELIPVQLQNHPRYRLIRILGRGGMGVVWLAEHLIMRRLVALKVMGSKFTAGRAAVERFQLEVRAAARLKHPNIVTAFDAEQAGDLHFLVMEYVEGLSLAEYVRKHGSLSMNAALDVIQQTCSGLGHAHRNGMIHRDIKPQNLMFDGASVVRILDFGLAKLTIPEGPVSHTAETELQLTSVGMVLGTPDYMAPEQAIDASSADARSDIYSLGCTWFFLLTGKAPFEGLSFEQMLTGGVRNRIAALKKTRSESMLGTLQLMARMTAEQPEDRPQSIEDVIRAIDEIRNIRQKTKAQKPEITEARRWPDRTGANQPDAPQRRDSTRSVDVPDRHSTQEVATTTPPAKTRLKPRHKWMAITGIFVLLLITGVLATNNGVFQATDEASQGDSAGTSPPDSALIRSAPPVNPSQTSRRRILFIVPASDFYWPDIGPLTQLLRDNGCEVVWSSWSSKATVLNKPQDTVPNLLLFNDVNTDDYDALIIGGGEGLIPLTKEDDVADEAERITVQMHKARKPIIALVAGPMVLAKMKLLDGVKATGVPPIHNLVRDNYGVELTGNSVEVSGQMITGRDNTEPVVRQLVGEIMQVLE